MNAPDTLDTTAGSNPYAAASAGAVEDLQTPAAPAAPAQPSATPTAEPTGAAPPAPPDPDVLELKVNGKVERISLSKERDKLVELSQKGLDYTQKTQAAAEERRQVEAYAQALQQREQELAAFLRDPLKVTQYAQYLLSQQTGQPAPSATDPNAVATVAEVRQALQAELAKAQEETQRTIAQAQFNAEVARYESEYQADLVKTAKAAIDKYPILDSVVEDAEELADLLKADLARKGMQPTTIDEAKEALLDLAKSRADKLHSKVTDHAKMEAVRAAKVAKTGPEPPGGAAPAPQSQSFKLGDPRLTAAAIEDMMRGRQ